MLFKKEACWTGGGPNPIPKPTDSNIIESMCIEGIPGTEFCDTGDNQRENNSSNSATHVISANVCIATTVISELPSIVNTRHPFACTNKDNSLPASKRPRTTGAKRELQGEEMLKIEKNIEEAVQAVSRQLGHINETLGNLVQEFRQTNNMLRVFLETIGSNEQAYQVPLYEQL